MKLRADVFIEKGLLMEALKDSETASDCRRLILQPPHLHYTESVYQLALVFMLIGISNADKNSEEARQNWDTSSAYFSELEENHLIDGGIPLNHPLFQEIKENHLKISELQEDETMKSRVKKLYEKLESGGFETNVKKGLKDFKKMSYTVKEIMQMMFKSGPSHFGEMEPVVEKIENDVDHQMERLMRKVPECNDSDSSCDLEGYISSEGSSNSDMERSDCYGCGTSSSDSDL